ncbi:hypothetical protein [Streptomyces sp. NPDC056982]|uniref:hypothetical protein n=1 Tax=Streptomyces sp. NPDC056982 TaxID=3345986 RepID=UPI0036444147
MDAPDLSALNDADYEQIAVNNAHPPARNADVWALLTQPDNLERTRQALVGAAQRTGNALRTRKAEREQFQQACFARGQAGKEDWFGTRAEYETWRKRAGNFHQTMLQAISELGKLQKRVNRETRTSTVQDHREVVRQLTVAVQRHQAMHMKAGEMPGQEDYELWQLLDRLTVPYGPDQTETTLRTMLDFCWSDVIPVDPVEERRAAVERAMRGAPSGRASQYSGVPRARHVGGGKDLAS